MLPPTLDPHDRLDPSTAAAVNLNELVERIRAYDDRDPILPGVSAEKLEAMLPAELPARGKPLDETLETLWEVAVEHGRRNRHPGFFGYVCSPGLPTDVVANAMTTALNQNVTGFSSAPGATTLERTFIRWMNGLVGMPESAGGLLLSGGSMANMTALTIGLHRCAGPELRTMGLAAMSRSGEFTLYASEATHFSVERAAIMLGIGAANVRKIPVDAEWRIVPDELELTLQRDVEKGFRPFCVVASAGSTTTGSIDPLDEIASVCSRNDVWMHVDGAYGAPAMLAPELRDRLKGIERADSISMDLHKWMFLSFDGSALLLRDMETAHRVFYTYADYVQIPPVPPPESFAFFHHSPETSRRDRALPAVLALMHYGADRMGRNVLHTVRCAAYLAELVESHPSLTLVARPRLSICCFRFDPPELAERPDLVDRCNTEIRRLLQQEGAFYLSETMLNGRPVLRVCVLNPATGAEHIEALVERVVRMGAALVESGI